MYDLQCLARVTTSLSSERRATQMAFCFCLDIEMPRAAQSLAPRRKLYKGALSVAALLSVNRRVSVGCACPENTT
jgi:hypothetical protein